MPLLNLPPEIILEIVQFATPEARVSLRRTCTYLKSLVDSQIRDVDLATAIAECDPITIIHLLKSHTYSISDWNRGLRKACFSGYMPIVRLAITNNLSHRDIDWAHALKEACLGGNLQVIKYIIPNIREDRVLAMG
jgi:hypothetical protein